MVRFRKNLFINLLVLFAVILYSSVSYATNAIKLIGLGPVQRGMGGASVGLPLDSATTVTNPAGMSEVNDRFDIGVTTIVPISSYEATSRSAQVTENGATIKSDTNPFIIPAVGFVVPVTEEVKFGFGIYSTSGAGVDYRSNLYNAVTYTYYTNTKIDKRNIQ